MGLTKEEFLDKKNIDIIREVKGALELKTKSKLLSNYWIEFYKEKIHNTPFSCEIHKRENPILREFNYSYECAFINIIDMIRDGKLIYFDKQTDEPLKKQKL